MRILRVSRLHDDLMAFLPRVYCNYKSWSGFLNLILKKDDGPVWDILASQIASISQAPASSPDRESRNDDAESDSHSVTSQCDSPTLIMQSEKYRDSMLSKMPIYHLRDPTELSLCSRSDRQTLAIVFNMLKTSAVTLGDHWQPWQPQYASALLPRLWRPLHTLIKLGIFSIAVEAQ